jgi:hypothetical protein
MSGIKRATFKVFGGPGSCSVPEGCTIAFDKDATFQYYPSNTMNYLLAVTGTTSCINEDNDVYLANNLYANTWSSYIEPWDYSKSVRVNPTNGVFAWITTENVTTSECTFKAANVVNESISHTSDKKTFLFVYGEDFLIDGEKKTKPDSNNILAAKTFVNVYPPGNTVTKTITANSTPVTVVVIEVN